MKAEVVAHLAYGALRALLSASWREGSRDEHFVRTYAPDRLTPFGPREREIYPALSGCLGCGACESAGVSPRVLLTASRGLPDLAWASGLVRELSRLDAGSLRALEEGCPARIPFSSLACTLSALGPDA